MVSHDNRTWIWNNHSTQHAQICGWRICAKFFVPPNFRLPHPLHWLQLDKCPQFYGRVSFLILVCSKWTHVFIAKSSTDMQLTASYHYFICSHFTLLFIRLLVTQVGLVQPCPSNSFCNRFYLLSVWKLDCMTKWIPSHARCHSRKHPPSESFQKPMEVHQIAVVHQYDETTLRSLAQQWVSTAH